MDDDQDIVAEAEAMLKENPERDQSVAMPYVPPSTTVIRTKADGWYYVTDAWHEAIELVDDSEKDGFVMFTVVGNEATQVAIRASQITAIVDLTPVSE